MKNVLRSLALLFLSVTLLPLSVAAEDKSQQQEMPNVMKLIDDNTNLIKFAAMIRESGMESALKSKDAAYTLFVPTDMAMTKMPEEILKRANENAGQKEIFVKYHIISGSKVTTSDIRGRRATSVTMNGEQIVLDGNVMPVKANTATFVMTDLIGSNGVVHVLDAVMIPPSMAKPLKDAAKTDVKAEPAPQPVAVKPVEEPAKAEAMPVKPEELKATVTEPTPPVEAAKTTDAPATPATDAATPSAEVPAPVPVPAEAVPANPEEPAKTGGIKGWFKKLMGK